MKNKSTIFEFILALIPAIFTTLITIIIILITIQLWKSTDVKDTGLILFDIAFETGVETVSIILGSTISIIALIATTLLYKAAFGLKQRKKGWAIFLIIISIIMIIPFQPLLIAPAILLTIAAIISLNKNKRV